MATAPGPRPRLTRSGVAALAVAVVAIGIGRTFGVLELYIAAGALVAVVVLGLADVAWKGLPLAAERWVHPPVVTVGDVGRVDLTVTNPRRRRAPSVTLTEPVGPTETARLTIAPLPGHEHVEASYRVPARRRGVLSLGPMELRRSDLTGVASIRAVVAPEVEIAVAPRTHELTMPDLGRGVLGRHLLVQAQRLGTGEFHSLRDYATGDEPRLIDWRASARTDGLKVRQNTTEGVRRCIVVLDSDAASYERDRHDGGDAHDERNEGDEAFERAVEATASLVHSAVRAGLTTRLVCGSDTDLRGPDVAATALRHLARIAPGGPLDEIERDPGEGLGLVVVVTPSDTTSAWRRTDQLLDPTLVRLGVAVGGAPRVPAGRLWVDATTIERLLSGWEALTGRRGAPAESSRLAPSVVPA